MTETEKLKPFRETYDLAIVAGGRRFYFKNKDRGITLTDWKLAWHADGQDDEAPLQDIASVRLMAGGDFKNPLNQCQITFADGDILTVTDGSAYGVADDAQTPLYRDFLTTLHARLALAPHGTIAFIQGYPQTNYAIVMVAACLLGIIGVVLPVVLLFIVQKLEVLLLLVAGIGLCWPLYKMVSANAPRPYNPQALPNELME
jgi:hypothetical protein